MSRLQKLYEKKQNFVSNKPKYEAEIMEELGGAETLVKKLGKLRSERKIELMKYDLEIAKLEAELAEKDVPRSKTERTKYLNLKLREKRIEINDDFLRELQLRYAQGTAVKDLVRECGASHQAQFYKWLDADAPEPSTVALAQATSASDIDWLYSDHKGTHKYAFDSERELLKFHGDEDFVIVRWPSKEFVSGDASLIGLIEEKRVQIAKEILDGTYEGAIISKPNPYEGK